MDPAPLNVVRMTPPVEATLRILLNSVPYLIGAAVVAASPLALLSAGAGFDPIVLGGVVHPSEPLVAWAALVSWTWR